ncbi:MAG: glycosyltransferase family 4 protein [Vulcanimicrobiota bacterium]
MRIAVDARMIGRHMHGIGRYAHLLINHYLRARRDDQYFLFHNHEPLTSYFPENVPVHYIRMSSPPLSLQEQWELPKLLRTIGPDLFHSPSIALSRLKVSATVLTIHDMIPFVLHARHSIKNVLYRRLILKKAACSAEAVLVDSEHTRKDVMELLGPPAENVHVIPLGVDELFFRDIDEDHMQAFRKKHRLEAPYFFTVVTPKPHKNAPFIVKAFERFAEKRDDALLVLGGLPGPELKEAVERSSARSRIRIADYISDDELPLFYRGALIFLFASLYEGFGLPPLEAMASGTPVITSNSTSLPEVVGDCGLYFDAGTLDEMLHAMIKLYDDRALREELSARGRTRAKTFTWERCAEMTYEIYERVAGLR